MADLEESILGIFQGRWLSLMDIWKSVRKTRTQTKKKELREAVLNLVERGLVVQGIYGQFTESSIVPGSASEPPSSSVSVQKRRFAPPPPNLVEASARKYDKE